MHDDAHDAPGSEDIWAVEPKWVELPTRLDAAQLRDDVVLHGITFRATGWSHVHGQPSCDQDGGVEQGAGYWVSRSDPDLCPWCFAPVRVMAAVEPTPEEQIEFGRVCIDVGGTPVRLTLEGDIEAALEALEALIAEFDLPRVVLIRTPSLRMHLDSGGEMPARAIALPRAAGQGATIDLRSFELQLRGLAFGPPMDPDLVARMAAAAGERGVIRDAALADEYFEAMQAQSAALDELLGRAEPVIEQGRAFPSLDEDAPPLD